MTVPERVFTVPIDARMAFLSAHVGVPAPRDVQTFVAPHAPLDRRYPVEVIPLSIVAFFVVPSLA